MRRGCVYMCVSIYINRFEKHAPYIGKFHLHSLHSSQYTSAVATKFYNLAYKIFYKEYVHFYLVTSYDFIHAYKILTPVYSI